MSAPIKICTRRSFRNRRGACSEIEEAFAFSKAGLLKDHEGRSQKSKRFAFSKAELLRDHEGRSQKSKRFAFSKAGLLRDHEGRSQKSKRHLLFQPCQHLPHPLPTRNSSSWVPHITLPKFSDKVETREACSSHYIALTKKGKRIAKKQH
ncbi:hypothetical protein ACFX1Z_018425 [Malus domestica]